MTKLTGRRLTVLAVAGVVLAVIAATALVLPSRSREPAAISASAKVNTTPILKTNLSDRQILSGTLGFGAKTTVLGRGTGVITKLPKAGRVTVRGHSLYRVNDQPVPVFYGDTPMFRTLHPPEIPKKDNSKPHSTTTTNGTTGTTGTTNDTSTGTGPPTPPVTQKPPEPSPPLSGHDVTVVAKNLSALGYHFTRSSTGSSDRYTTSLGAAVKRWQRDLGVKATGTLRVGQVLVLPGPVRIDSVQAQLGDDVAEPLISVTSTRRVVTVPIDAGAPNPIAAGAKVRIELPDSTKISGRVSSISRTVKSGSADDPAGSGPPTQTVIVRPLHPSDVAGLDSAAVQVQFSSGQRRGVLAVPVSALLALRGGGYALQRPDQSLVAVKTGLFADGMVEVDGPGLDAGMLVQTSS